MTFIVSSDWLSARQYPQWKSEKTVTVCDPEPQTIAPFFDSRERSRRCGDAAWVTRVPAPTDGGAASGASAALFAFAAAFALQTSATSFRHAEAILHLA